MSFNFPMQTEPDKWLKNLLSPSRDDLKWSDNAYFKNGTPTSDSNKKNLIKFCFENLKNSNESSSSYTDGITTITVTRVTNNSGYMFYVIKETVNVRLAYVPADFPHPCQCDKNTLATIGCSCGGR